MPAFDGRDGVCGRSADRMISDPSLGRGKLYVCPFHAVALMRVWRRAHSSGGVASSPGAADSGGGSGGAGSWKSARSKFKPVERGWGEYLLLLVCIIGGCIFAALFIFGPNVFDAINAFTEVLAQAGT